MPTLNCPALNRNIIRFTTSLGKGNGHGVKLGDKLALTDRWGVMGRDRTVIPAAISMSIPTFPRGLNPWA